MTFTKQKIDLPKIKLKKDGGRRFFAYCPWVFSNEIEMDIFSKAITPGALTILTDCNNKELAVGTFNPHSLIAFRVFSYDASQKIDKEFFVEKVNEALFFRSNFFNEPFYRLIYSEADGLPGFIVDRYGDVFCIQANTAGAENLSEVLADTLIELFKDSRIVFKNDTSSRKLEGLSSYIKVYNGEVKGAVPITENGGVFYADVADGQKTGWFYDQRDNRAFAAKLANGKRIADFYCYAGGFSILSALMGAKEVVAVDRSERALQLAKMAAEKNQVVTKCRFVEAEAFSKMEEMAQSGEKFGLVIADPPAFIKNKKDAAQGAKGYRKMAKLAAELVDKSGFLLLASCSHHITVADFITETVKGINQAGRTGKIIKVSGAGLDHPVHGNLPEASYLKAVFFHLD